MNDGHRILRVGRVSLWCVPCALHLAIATMVQAAPPRILSLDPLPQNWTVDDTPLQTVTLSFDMPVRIPAGAVTARALHTGPLQVSLSMPFGEPTASIELELSPLVTADVVTLVIDYSIINEAGLALDGEASDPKNPTLPTGNSRQGGQAVFELTVLQGDVNRDGTVNVVDAILQGRAAGTCSGTPGFNSLADLNGDGCVNETDAAIISAGFGGKLRRPTGAAPAVTLETPGPLPLDHDELVIRFSEVMNPATLTPTTVFGLGRANDELIVPSQTPSSEDGRTFRFLLSEIACLRDYDFVVSHAAESMGGAKLSFQPPQCGQCEFTISGEDLDPPIITCPEALYVNSTEPFKIGAAEVLANLEIQSFLEGAVAVDSCGPTTTITSLDQPIDLPLGLTMVEFTAQDSANPPNAATCAAPLIVVPSVPIYCWDLNVNGEGDLDTEDFNDDGVVDILDCRGSQGIQGEQGQIGVDGIDCWDTNENGRGDLPEEDTNADGLVDTNDCLGEQGPQGAIGGEGAIGATGAAGATGPAGVSGLAGPPGAAGSVGPTGPAGLAGATGAQGLTGLQGETGPPGIAGRSDSDGSDGANCWDFNENGIADPEEDANDDGQINTEDCRGTEGEAVVTSPAPKGILCGSLGMLNMLVMLCCLSFAKSRGRTGSSFARRQ